MLGNGKEPFTTNISTKEEVKTTIISIVCQFFLFWSCLIAQVLNGISLSNSTRHAGFSEDSYIAVYWEAMPVYWKFFGTVWYLEYRMTVYWYTDTASGPDAVSVSNTAVYCFAVFFHHPLMSTLKLARSTFASRICSMHTFICVRYTTGYQVPREILELPDQFALDEQFRFVFLIVIQVPY